MSGSRPRRQYGRSATTCYSNILPDSSGDLLNRCSNLFSRLASRVRSSSQTGDDRLPLGDATMANNNVPPPRVSSYSQYPLLVKYSKYDDPHRYDKYSDHKTSSRYDDPTSSPRFRSRASGLAPSASFSSFSNYKNDYGAGASDYSRRDPDYSSKPTDYSTKPTDYSLKATDYSSRPTDYSSSRPTDYSSSRPTDYSSRATDYSLKPTDYSTKGTDYSTKGTDYSTKATDYSTKATDLSSSRASDLTRREERPEEGGYGLKGIYSSASSSHIPANQDKIGSRYRPSRFLKSSFLKGRCDEGDEDALLTRSGLSSKQPDYWSHYTAMSPSYLMEKYASSDKKKISPQLRQKYGLDSGAGGGRQRPVTVPERLKSPRARVLECSPDNTAAILRRRECAQLINMYSLPLDTLQNMDKSRKFRKRGQEGDAAEATSRFDQVKQMAAQVSCLRADDDSSLGPPRKVLYGSASTGDMLSSLSKGSTQKSSGTSGTPSVHSTPDSDKFVLHEAPIVFEKAAMKEKPASSRPTYLYLSDTYDKYPYLTSYTTSNSTNTELVKSPACSTGVLSSTNSSDPSSPLSNFNINVNDTSSSTSSTTNDTPSSKNVGDASTSESSAQIGDDPPLSSVSGYTASVRSKHCDYFANKPSSASLTNYRDEGPQDLSFSTFRAAQNAVTPTTYVAGVAYVEASQPKPMSITYLSPVQPKPSIAGISYVPVPEEKPENLCSTVKANASTTTTLTDMSPRSEGKGDDAYALSHYKSLAVKGVGMGQRTAVLPSSQDVAAAVASNSLSGARTKNLNGLDNELAAAKNASGLSRCNNVVQANDLRPIPVVSGSSKSSKFSSLYGSSSVSSDDVSSQGNITALCARLL